jgi:predicted transcriptional regulator
LKNNNSLLLNSINILLSCKKPNNITEVRKQTSHNGVVFKYYIEYLCKQELVTVNKSEQNNKVLITDKGKEILRLWIEINEGLGIKICQYI